MPREENREGPAVASTGTRFHSLGMGLLVLALVAVLTGIVLLPFYQATAAGAHGSVQAMERSAPLRVVRAAHHWASALLILLGAIYLVYGAFTSAYRRPLHLAWVAAVGLFLLYFLFQLTGHLLPWDSLAVSTAAIEAGIAANAPVVGPVQAQLVRGGEEISPHTLTLWYTAHVALLPVALLVLAGLFLWQARRIQPRWRIPGPGLAVALVILLGLAVALPAPLGPPATVADYRSFAAPPEWYTAPLHGLLTLAQRIRPSLAFLGTMVVPGMVVLALVILPWLDRRQVGEPASRPVHGVAALVVAGFLVLTAMNLGHIVPPFGGGEAVDQPRIAGKPPPNVRLDPALVQKGKQVYQQQGCAGCHKVGGQGGAVGPALDGVGSGRHADLDWQIRHLKKPNSVVPGSTMPKYGHLSEADLKALATYLLSLK